MNKKLLISIISLLALMVLCTLSVNAVIGGGGNTIAWSTPFSNQGINGTFNFSVSTVQYGDGGGNISNVSFYYRTGTSGAWTLFASFGNATANITSWSKAFDTSGLTDGSTYQFNATAHNITIGATGGDDAPSVVLTGLLVDNTAPTASISISKAIVERTKVIELDCSGSTDTVDTSLTVNFTIYIDEAGSGVWAVKSSFTRANTTNLRYEFDDGVTDTIAEYMANCIVYDDIANGDWGTNQSFRVVGQEDEVIKTPEEEAKAKDNRIIIIVVMGVLIIIIGGIIVLQQKRKN